MSDLASHLAALRDPRLAALATSAAPAWLWSTDTTRLLWANPVGAAIFGLASPAQVEARRFDPRDQVAAQIARLVGTLRLGGAARLERLRGFGTGFWRALLCSCSRVTLADHTPGVLVVAMEPAGPALTLAERVRRLYDGTGLGVAAFAPDGSLVYATPQARARLGGHVTLAALGAAELGADAAALGRAEGEIPLGRVAIERLGTEATTILAATISAEPAAAPAPPPAAPVAAEPVAGEPVAAEPPPIHEEPPPEVVAPPTVPAAPVVPEAPPVAPDMPEAEQPATPVAHEPEAAPDTVHAAPPDQPAAAPSRIDMPAAERRHPLRFVWQMDASGRFTLGSDEFTEVIGPRIAIALGRPWREINDELALDPENQVARAVATRDTWSGITVSWPVDGSADRLKVELSGLPIYDRDRNFLGYRGFGVCRDVDRIATLAMMRRSAHATQPTPPTGVAAPAAAATDADARPTLTVVPSARNVVPFRSAAAAPEARSPGLSPVERNAFHELARQLTARLKGDTARDAEAPAAEPAIEEPAPAVQDLAAAAPATATPPAPVEPADLASPPTPEDAAVAGAAAPAAPEPAPRETAERPLLDRIPVGILVYRLDTLLYANRAFLEWTGYAHIDALADAGGLDSLFVEGGAEHAVEPGDASKRLTIATARGDRWPVEARLFSIAWDGEPALVLMLVTSEADARLKASETALQTTQASLLASETALHAAQATLQAKETSLQTTQATLAARETALQTAQAALQASEASLHAIQASLQSSEASLRSSEASRQAIQGTLQATEMSLRLAQAQVREFTTILDTATDGVVVIGPDGRILSGNRSAEALFGYDTAELAAQNFADLFAPASRAAALDYLDGVARGSGGGLIHDSREFAGQVRQGGTIPLFMTLGRIADDSQRVCAVFRDITPWKKAEHDLVAAREAAEKASAAKSDFLAKVSHEIRTPLNSIIGFSEVMLEERFGPIGNERYRDYLKDIRSSGDHVVALINDLLDLAKIESGKLELAFADLNLNELVQGAVALMQPQANRERIIIRTSLAPALRPVVADARAVRQIALNLLSNSIKFTGAGGQVIVSTAQSDAGEVLLRVRDTGIGMDEKELGVALEPFRQLATAARWGSGGTGLGLPLTKALAEANRARFTITSKVNDGTLVEVAFPATHVHAE